MTQIGQIKRCSQVIGRENSSRQINVCLSLSVNVSRSSQLGHNKSKDINESSSFLSNETSGFSYRFRIIDEPLRYA